MACYQPNLFFCLLNSVELRTNFLVTNWIKLTFTLTAKKIRALYFNGLTEKVKDEEREGRK
jgi:hypothetical protein